MATQTDPLDLGKTGGLCSGFCGYGNAGHGLFEPVALAFELQHVRAVHEPIQNGGGHGGVAQILAPVLHDAVGGDDDGAAQLVALVHDGLQYLGTHIGNAPGQKQVIQNQQVRLHIDAQ